MFSIVQRQREIIHNSPTSLETKVLSPKHKLDKNNEESVVTEEQHISAMNGPSTAGVTFT